MKNINKTLLVVLAVLGSLAVNAQQPKKVKLTQTPGEFEKTELKLKAGKEYVFEIANDGIDHEVGFVIAPKGKTEQANHITEAYVQKTIADGEKSVSNVVTLEAGEYVYFCPMNPTPLYTLVVE